MPRDAMHAEMPDSNSSTSSQAHYLDQVFKDEQLEHAELVSSEFYDSVFLSCSFVEAVFRSCRFVNCAFRECDLSMIQVPESTFASTRFEASKVIGVNWTEAHWPKIGLADPIGFFMCSISHSTFIGLKLEGLQVRDCVATDVDFREADLSKVDFAGSDLSESMFGNTNLSEADLSRARNYHIDPGQNVLKQAKFSLPEAMSLLYNLDIVLVEED